MDKVLVIVGPTAVGKTALSIQLAKKFNGEIISGDSMQIYCDLNIGTAKVTAAEMAGVPHYLINERKMDENYSVADFQASARQKIQEIKTAGKLPIIVGGTGLYIQALLYDFKLGGKEELADQELRADLEKLAAEIGNQELWQLLQTKDTLAASKIHFNNRKKVIRALEVFEKTGQSIFTPQEEPQALYDYLMIGLNTQRELLYNRINQRVDLMLTEGLLAEAESLAPHPEYQSAQGIGYKEFFPYFASEATLEEAVEQVKQNSRRYAKRQLTWFRNRSQAQWFDLVTPQNDLAEIEQLVNDWLK
ncbi:tRNA dimethylallyltransferase [Enterococcus sp. PF1-24]|uniref:tRNA (adenosine(37)-N6)-dimethylallyltransferase MiaA n=1 Tax=unclassified Enterococcus TaxID=2608891 RepID=UPI0024747401|nr:MULTISPECIES: tRNA (adenosine(37)-N6)-dimethylallyltransferase MiaA [unclassified Enterococcus]MDH6364806.1 tRNA dimethylallyltransferase [Enterococcus sp. PFB1-1]MDH6401849.1 tRNA dimethylallyltransferase [Enterococcus sp. PF1-24]